MKLFLLSTMMTST